MEKIIIDGRDFEAWQIPTETAAILLIKAPYGFIGCGYFDVATANKLNERVGIVTGVKTFDDMLDAKIVKCSELAEVAGITVGMTGREALLKLS